MLLFPLLLTHLVLLHTTRAGSTDGGCIVKDAHDLPTYTNTSILGFLASKQPLRILLKYRDLDDAYDRDVLDLSLSATTHYMVREGNSVHINSPLPLGLYEGWNRLRLLATERNLSMEWISESEQVTLFSLPLSFTVDRIFLRGIFSICSGDSPEWEVKEGEKVGVPLQPQKNEQHLVVQGPNGSRPYLEQSSESHTTSNVTVNTTLTVKTRRNGSRSTINITQGDQEVLHEKQSLQPMIIVGSLQGNTVVRLDLSDSPRDESCTLKLQNTVIVLTCFLTAFITAIIILACLLFRQKLKVHSMHGRKPPAVTQDKSENLLPTV